MDLKYQVPLKIIGIVRQNEEEMRARLAQETECCPFFGYIRDENRATVRDSGWDSLQALIGPWVISSGEGQYVLKEVQGCSALKDQICYLRRGTEKQPLVLSKEECPVYQTTLRLL